MSTTVKVFKKLGLEVSACSTKDGAQLDIQGSESFIQLRLTASETFALIRALAYALMMKHKVGYLSEVATTIYSEASR